MELAKRPDAVGPRRGDEPDRPRLAVEHLVQGAPSLAEREVERRRLEPPAPQLRQTFEECRERLERVLAHEPGRRTGGLEPSLVIRVVDDVLAEPLLAPTFEVNQRPADQELLGDGELEPFELAALDNQWQSREKLPGGHAPACS